ncbi:MAG: hypothetical protein ACOX6S_06510 [Clostridia bacterium]
MICPSCHTRNNYYHRYCYYCGTKLNNEEFTEDKGQELFDEDEMLHEEYPCHPGSRA